MVTRRAGVFQLSPVVKNLPANAGDIRDSSSVPGSGRSPGGGHGNPLQYSCLENPHGQRSLVGYSPWGRKESDMTERLTTITTFRLRVIAAPHKYNFLKNLIFYQSYFLSLTKLQEKF